MNKTKDINDMLLFNALIDAGSFTLAAERLHIPKANLSRRITNLEQRLGTTLIERTTRRQHITEAGQRYLQHCRRVQHEVELADIAVDEMLQTVQGQLRVGTSVGIGQAILKAELSTFISQYPQLNLQLNLLNRRVDLIEEGFDMLIRIGELQDSRLIARLLGTIQRKIYVSPSYLKTVDVIEHLSNLQNKDFLLMSSIHSGDLLVLQSGSEQQQITVNTKVAVDDFLILKQMAIDGLGFVILPSYMCDQSLKQGQLVEVLPQWGMPPVDVYALYPKHKIKLPKVSLFLAHIQEVFKQRL